jgi:hypothetical protein
MLSTVQHDLSVENSLTWKLVHHWNPLGSRQKRARLCKHESNGATPDIILARVLKDELKFLIAIP